MKGIFTLLKENKEVETKIINASKEIEKIENDRTSKNTELEAVKTAIRNKLETAKNKIWEMKKNYSGGDRVLEFCLEDYKSSKDNLFNHIININISTERPNETVDQLKNNLQSISGENAQKYDELSNIIFTSSSIEEDTLFSKQIIGNENSSVSQLIQKLGNSDWVKAGLEYLKEPINNLEICPFCQEKTISEELLKNIKNYFDASYEADINSLKTFLEEYTISIQSLPSLSIFDTNPKFQIYKKDFEIKYNILIKIVEKNRKLIEDKIKNPSV